MTDHERLCELLDDLLEREVLYVRDRERIESMLTRLRSDGPDGIRTVPVVAIDSIGDWLSAALEDPQVCEEMKSDIQMWFALVNNLALTGKDCSTKKPC